MLVFFIHGVATQNAGYADSLKKLIKDEFAKRNTVLPHFYSSFWGAVLNKSGQMWNWIHQDLQKFSKKHANTNARDVFRYQEFREDFISKFFGDFLTYFNPQRGAKIREQIFYQLEDFLKEHPAETDLHIVAHSLGSVILWDILFSERLDPDDPAYRIRRLIAKLSHSSGDAKLHLRSICTMGSPLLFFSMMLDVVPERIKTFANASDGKVELQPGVYKRYSQGSARWTNIIHASDIVAYPICASLNPDSSSSLFLRDKFIWADANVSERGARTFGQAHAAMALGVADAHSSYWQSRGTARLITANILGDFSAIDADRLDLE